jgi:hypothetical protein
VTLGDFRVVFYRRSRAIARAVTQSVSVAAKIPIAMARAAY